jgi:hypothetical protein
MSSGSSPSNCTPYCAAMRAPPPLPKMCSTWPHWLQTCTLMFSTTPSTRTSTFSNILRPLRASSSAMSWGVVTMTAPLTGTRCASVSWMSPVPGRHVDHQVIELAPVGVAQQLRQRLGHHRPAPDHGLLGIDHEADRHDLDAVGAQRRHVLAVGRSRLGPPGPSSAAGWARRYRHPAGRPARPAPPRRAPDWPPWSTCRPRPCRRPPPRCS